jgi:hypothetical protein
MVAFPPLATREFAWRKARYLHFLDADDSLHPDALAALVDAMGGSDTRLCLMGFRSFEGDARADAGSALLPPAQFSLLPDLLHHNPTPPNCYLCATAMAARVGGFDQDLKACEDWDFWIRVALEGVDCVAVPLIGAYYRRHPESMSRNPSLMLRERTRVLLRATVGSRRTPKPTGAGVGISRKSPTA